MKEIDRINEELKKLGYDVVCISASKDKLEDIYTYKPIIFKTEVKEKKDDFNRSKG